MKVRCVRLVDVHGNPVEKSAWLTIDKTYHVLEILVGAPAAIKFRLLGDDNTPALYSSVQFEIVTDWIPTCWGIDFGSNEYMKMAPRPSLQKGFWERYFDDDQDAEKVFQDIYNSIIAEEP